MHGGLSTFPCADVVLSLPFHPLTVRHADASTHAHRGAPAEASGEDDVPVGIYLASGTGYSSRAFSSEKTHRRSTAPSSTTR